MSIYTFFSAKKYQKALATASSLTLSGSQAIVNPFLKMQNSLHSNKLHFLNVITLLLLGSADVATDVRGLGRAYVTSLHVRFGIFIETIFQMEKKI